MLVERNVNDKISIKQIDRVEKRQYVFPPEAPSVLDLPDDLAKRLIKSAPNVFSEYYGVYPIVKTEDEPAEPVVVEKVIVIKDFSEISDKELIEEAHSRTLVCYKHHKKRN